MKKEKRIKNRYAWVPQRWPGRIPGPEPPERAEERKPLYLLIPDNDGLYFVNYSDETLTCVSSSACGIERICDEGDYLPVGGPSFKYESVKPKEAIKIEKYDPIGDSDCILQVEVSILHPSSGGKVFRVSKKGGIDKETVLLWDNGDVEKGVQML